MNTDKKPTGGPAFPTAINEGMTLRDRFAIEVLPTLIEMLEKVRPDAPSASRNLVMARMSYEFADAMLKARKE